MLRQEVGRQKRSHPKNQEAEGLKTYQKGLWEKEDKIMKENYFQPKIHSKPNYQNEQRINNFKDEKFQKKKKIFPPPLPKMLIDNVLHKVEVHQERGTHRLQDKEDPRRKEQ